MSPSEAHEAVQKRSARDQHAAPRRPGDLGAHGTHHKPLGAGESPASHDEEVSASPFRFLDEHVGGGSGHHHNLGLSPQLGQTPSSVLEFAPSLLETLGACRQDHAGRRGFLCGRNDCDTRVGSRDIQSLLERPVRVLRPVKPHENVLHARQPSRPAIIRRSTSTWGGPAATARGIEGISVSGVVVNDRRRAHLLLFDPLAVPSEILELSAEREPVVMLTAPWHERHRKAGEAVASAGVLARRLRPRGPGAEVRKYGVTPEQAAGGNPMLPGCLLGGEAHLYSAVERLPIGLEAEKRIRNWPRNGRLPAAE